MHLKSVMGPVVAAVMIAPRVSALLPGAWRVSGYTSNDCKGTSVFGKTGSSVGVCNQITNGAVTIELVDEGVGEYAIALYSDSACTDELDSGDASECLEVGEAGYYAAT